MQYLQRYLIGAACGAYCRRCNSCAASAAALVLDIGEKYKCRRIFYAESHTVIYVYGNIGICKLVLLGMPDRAVHKRGKTCLFVRCEHS